MEEEFKHQSRGWPAGPDSPRVPEEEVPEEKGGSAVGTAVEIIAGTAAVAYIAHHFASL